MVSPWILSRFTDDSGVNWTADLAWQRDGRSAGGRLPARRQQHGSNQQQAAEAETQATFGQSIRLGEVAADELDPLAGLWENWKSPADTRGNVMPLPESKERIEGNA